MSEWNFTPDPNFDRLRTALLRQGEPDRVPFYDGSVDILSAAGSLDGEVVLPGFRCPLKDVLSCVA